MIQEQQVNFTEALKCYNEALNVIRSIIASIPTSIVLEVSNYTTFTP